MRQAVLSLVGVLVAGPAFAQSAYVAAGVGADVFRPRRIDARGVDNGSAAGEAVSFSARVGTAVTDRWGVELEFTRAMDIEREVRRGFPVPLLRNVVVAPGPALFPIWNDPSTWNLQPLTPITFESTTRVSRRNATLDAVLWVAQPIGSRVDLIYLGGVAFTRAVEKMQFSFGPRAGLAPTIVVPNSTRTTTYGAGPVAGLEARVRLTDHVFLLPGIRLHAMSADTGAAWLVRPAVGLGWQF